MTPFITRYKKLFFTSANLIITGLVLALAFAGVLLEYMTFGRAIFLTITYCGFMLIYQALNAKFLYEEKYQVFAEQGQTALGNPISNMPQIGRVLHYLLIGTMFSVALGASDADPNAAFRGFSTMGLIYAAAYGLFNEMNIRRQKKQNSDDK